MSSDKLPGKFRTHDPRSNFGEGGITARRSVIAEGCEAAVVGSTELLDRYVLRCFQYTIANFFRERRFRVAGTERCEWIVGERRPESVRGVAGTRLHRDWLREGILHESSTKGLRIDLSSAKDISNSR